MPIRSAFSRLRATGAAAGVAACMLAALPATAADLIVNVDEASIFRLHAAAATIIVGNPSMADVNVQSGSMLIVTGKNPGNTNIIALDRKGSEIDNVSIHVRNSGNRKLTLFRGAGRTSYNCAPYCDHTLSVGDTPGVFNDLQKQMNGKAGMAQGNVDAAASAE